MPCNDLSYEKIKSTCKYHKNGYFADTSCALAKEECKDIFCGSGTLRKLCKGSCGSYDVGCKIYVAKKGKACLRNGESRAAELVGIGKEEKNTRRKSGVYNVLADAAVKLLDNNDGKESTDNGKPERNRNGQNASSTPVTAAERSPTEQGFFTIRR